MPYDFKPLAWKGDWKDAHTEGQMFCRVVATHGGAEPAMSYWWDVCVTSPDAERDDGVIVMLSGHMLRPVTFEQAKSVAEENLRKMIAEHLEEVK